jgi:PIN domain nuclease of toxin-antitoxin system
VIYVLDTFALLAFFWKEPGYQKVRPILLDGFTKTASIHMSLVNLGEMFYMSWKKRNATDCGKDAKRYRSSPNRLRVGY